MIINTDEIKNIYVTKQFCDMRKQIDGLALIVISQFNMNVLDHSLFIFTNASRNRIKMLYYEANGFWLFTRRLENGKFKFKRHEESDSWKLNLEQKYSHRKSETESTVLKIEPELQIKVTSHSRKKSKKRGIEDLPETVVEHDLEDKTDPQTGKPLRLIGTNERKELVHHKEYYEVIKHIQYVYSGEYDEEIETTPMYKGDMPKAVITKALLHYHCLHRYLIKIQSFFAIIQTGKALERTGIILSRQTMSNWIMKLYDLYFQEFVEYMHNQLLKCEYINADETKLEVLELKKSEDDVLSV